MTKIMHRVINDIQELSQIEKNNLIKFLIASMDETYDENSENEWANVSIKRYNEIIVYLIVLAATFTSNFIFDFF